MCPVDPEYLAYLKSTAEDVAENPELLEAILANKDAVLALVANENFMRALLANETFLRAIRANDDFMRKLLGPEFFEVWKKRGASAGHAQGNMKANFTD